MRLPRAFALGAVLASCVFAQAEPVDALAVYKSADYKTAIPLLQAAAVKTPPDPVIHAALLSALVYEGRVDDAADLAAQEALSFPDSPEVMAARGEFAFHMGDMPEAEKLWVAAANLKNTTARAYFGLSRLYKAASMYRSARLRCLLAHEMDPDDALITRTWLDYLTPQKTKELLPPFAAAHPWLYHNYQMYVTTHGIVEGDLNQRKAFELIGEPKEEDVRLYELHDSPTRVRGVGVEFAIGDAHPMRLLLDTGASGILLSQATIDRAGLEHLGSTETHGIGDKGSRTGFVSVSNECHIGPLHYKACVVEALNGKGRVAGDEDGLIGTDVFSDYLIQLDFQKHLLHLTPQPPRPPNPQGYDREKGPAQNGFTPVFRFGHSLMVSTRLNGKTSGLFLLETGSSGSLVDSTFARLSTKIHNDDYMRLHGVSGEVKQVFEADKALIEFSVYRQRNIGLNAINLNNSPEHSEVRMDGILGMPVLAMFRLTLDYRNGLVKFDYVLK